MFYGDWLHQRELLSPNKIALVDAENGDIEISYRQWNCRVNRLAHFFQGKLGIEKGNRISISSVNRVEYLDALFACNQPGAILQATNWRLTVGEMEKSYVRLSRKPWSTARRLEQVNKLRPKLNNPLKERTMRLKGKVALITGGADGIGKATAKVFVDQGAIVCICDINENKGQKTAEELGCTFFKVDVSNRQTVQAWVDDVIEQFGRVDILINNAGILRDATLVKVKDGELIKQMSEENFDAVIAVNLKGVFNCTQAVAPYMIRQGSGSIVNASSVVGLDGNFGQTNYVASKAAVVGMTKVWARELGRKNVRVNAIAPGLIMTEMIATMPEKIREMMKSHTPMGRFGDPREVANAYLFLASDEASFITGAVLRVDGGSVVGT
jgi:3-oxoacyl-[acyl-carrier protein] reductase